jgi:translation elongation factor EF-G
MSRAALHRNNMLPKVWKNGDAMVDRPYSESPDYRETIRRAAFGERKYIRYLAGRGHFAHLRLQLIPCPGELCRVTKLDGLEIPELCCDAARASIFKRFEAGPIGSYPMLGLEVRIVGGTFLPEYSNPEAFARAAAMAFDEAIVGASPAVVERWIGFVLRVDPGAIRQTLETLISLLDEVPASFSWNSLKECFVVRAQAPVRLLAEVRQIFGLRRLETFPLPTEQQYRVTSEFPPRGRTQGSQLDDWT